MECTPTTHRILASLLVVLLAVLAPLGRVLETAVLTWLPLKPAFLSGVGLAASILVVVARQNLVSIWTSSKGRWLAVGIIVQLAVCVRLVQSPAEWSHVVLYAALAFTLEGSVIGRYRWASALGIGFFVGVLDEALQALLPNRVADPWDLLLNSVGLTLGVGVALGAALPVQTKRVENAGISVT